MKLDVGLGVEGRHLPSIPGFARAAEELGFAGLWASETRHDPFLPLVLAAEHTAEIDLGTAVAIAFARSPMVTAQTAWDLQAMSRGRLRLGLGTQVKAHIERRFGMPWDAPVARLRDYISALQAIWHTFQTGEPLRYRGTHYRHTLMTPFFNPGPIEHPHIAIAIAGVNAGLAQLAGELGTGFHVHPFHSPRYLDTVVRPGIAAGAARARRAPGAVELIASVFLITGRDADTLREQRERVRAQLAFYAATPTYRAVLEPHGWQEVGSQLAMLARQQRWAEMPGLISDEMLSAFALTVDPDEAGAAVRERYRGLVDRVTLYLPFVPGQDDAFWRRALRQIVD